MMENEAQAALRTDDPRRAEMKTPDDVTAMQRLFATLWTDEDRVVLRLMPELQVEMVEAWPDEFEPVPGSWGTRGWTSVDLFAVEKEVLRSALLAAWKTAAPSGLVARFAALAVDPEDDR